MADRTEPILAPLPGKARFRESVPIFVPVRIAMGFYAAQSVVLLSAFLWLFLFEPPLWFFKAAVTSCLLAFIGGFCMPVFTMNVFAGLVRDLDKDKN